MKDIVKSVLSIVGPAFAVLLLGFTGYQTWSLLLAVSGSPIIAAIGLILFEVGMVYWWWVFRTDAEGLPQMALSLLVFVACLMFVVIATALKLGAVDAALLGVNTAAKIITAAAVIQLAAKLIFPLLHPEVMQAIKDRVQDGKITSLSDKKFDSQIDQIADTYADARVAVKTAEFLTRLNTKYGTAYQLPGGHAPVVIENQASAAPARRSWVDRLAGRKPDAPTHPAPQPAAAPPQQEPAQPATRPDYTDEELGRIIRAQLERDPNWVAAFGNLVGNSTHDTARHAADVIPLAQPAAGQGEQGNGRPARQYGGDTRP